MAIKLPNILVIEDSTSIRLFVQQVLAGGGFNVDCVKDGLMGIEQSKKISYDLIIVDYHMPGMNGDRVTKTIRARPDGKTVPILIMTTESDPSVKANFKSIGASGWLEKPLDATRILTAVSRSLKRG
ncbi:MAG: two-component system chemotaxis response regulator CheY [Phenylobacterium sp.]|jgi:two-component system chemotaxis response regulator CheY